MKKILGLALLFVVGAANATYCGTGGTTHWNTVTSVCEPNSVSNNQMPSLGQQQTATGTGTSGVTTSSNDVAKSLALGVMLPKIDGLPALPKLNCPSANYYQETQGGFGWGLVTTRGYSKADSTGCEVVEHYNSMIDNCRWESAANLQASRLSNIVPNYKPNVEPGLINLSTQECLALRARPVVPAVLPPTKNIHPPVKKAKKINNCGCKKQK